MATTLTNKLSTHTRERIQNVTIYHMFTHKHYQYLIMYELLGFMYILGGTQTGRSTENIQHFERTCSRRLWGQVSSSGLF